MNIQIGIEGNKTFYGVFYGVRSDGTGDYVYTEQDLLSNTDFVIRSRFGYAEVNAGSPTYEYHFAIRKNRHWHYTAESFFTLENLYTINGWSFRLSLETTASTLLTNGLNVDVPKYIIYVKDNNREEKSYLFEQSKKYKGKQIASINGIPTYSFFHVWCSEIIQLLNDFKVNNILNWKDLENKNGGLYERFSVARGYYVPVVYYDREIISNETHPWE
jgi:hypothetical protein